MSLNLFPARVAIGRFADPNDKNKNIDVYSTPEFFRAMSELFNRVGGANGASIDDLALLSLFSGTMEIAVAQDSFGQETDLSAETSARLSALSGVVGDMQLSNASAGHDSGIAKIEQAMADVQQLAASVASLTAEVQELRKSAASVEMATGYQDQFRVNWERPGKIGALTANMGAFTTLTASAAVTLSPANANVSISPTGTGLVTINPGTAGAMDNVDIGVTTPKTIKSTTLTATGAVALSPANANVVLSPTGTGVVTIAPATAGSIDNVNIGATTQGTVKGTTITATGLVQSGVTGTAGMLKIARASDGAFVGTDTMNGNVREIDNQAGEIVLKYGSSEKFRAHINGATVTGSLTVSGGAAFLFTSSALTDGAGAGAGTITNAPAAGNPTKWIAINDNGTLRYCPVW